MFYLRYLCLFAHRGVKYILCCVFCFVCLRLVFCVPNVACLSGLSILDCRSETSLWATSVLPSNENHYCETTKMLLNCFA